MAGWHAGVRARRGSSVMQNSIIMVGAIFGILIGGWLGVFFFNDPGNTDPAVMILLGAMPGSIAGGWLGYKLSDR